MTKKPVLYKTLVVVVIVLFIGVGVQSAIAVKSENSSSFEVTITEPQRGIYCNDEKILPFIVPFILWGDISIKAEVTPGVVDRVEFYAKNEIIDVIEGPGPDYTLSLTWNLPFLGRLSVKVVAYSGDETASDRIMMWRVFP